MFQKLKIEVAMAKKYNGNVNRIPAEKLEDMYQMDPSESMAQMNEELGLNYESLEQTKKKRHKQRRERRAVGGEGGGGGGGGDGAVDDDPYKLKSIRRRMDAVCRDAETGEKITIREQAPEDVALAGRRMDNLLWRQRLVTEVKEALDHPEYPNTRVLARALAIYAADPNNAVPQPMSRATKYEKKGQVYAMLQVLRQTHAKQVYAMVLEEEARDQKRVQLMDWARDADDPARVAKLVKRFKRERERWREFIALVQHDNQMKIAQLMTTYGMLR